MPLLYLGLGVFTQFVMMGNDFLEMVTNQIRSDNPEEQGYVPLAMPASLVEADRSIRQLLDTIVEIDQAPHPALTTRLPLPDHKLTFPNCELLAKIVEMADRETPIPLAVISAHGLLAYLNAVAIEFIDGYENTSIYADPEEAIRYIAETKVGLAAVAHYTKPNNIGKRISRNLHIIEYVELLMNSLWQSITVIKIICDAVPKDIQEAAATRFRKDPADIAALLHAFEKAR